MRLTLLYGVLLLWNINLFSMHKSPQPTIFTRLSSLFTPFWRQSRALHPDYFKGTHSSFMPGYQHLSPLNGAILAESNWIERLYKFGNEKHATVKLAQALFNKLHTRFRPTHNKSLLGASLNPELTANILTNLEQNKLTDPVTKTNLANQWRAQHKKACNQVITAAKAYNTLDLINQSHQESQTQNPSAPYRPYTTQTILLGHMVKKATDKKDLIPYYTRLQQQIPEAIIPSFNQTTFAADHYNQKDFEHYESRLSRMPLSEILNHNFEKTAVFALRSYVMPSVDLQHHSYNNNPAQPDCMEGLLREFFNRYLKDTHHFDLTLLSPTLCPRPEFINFYTTYNDFKSINNYQTGNAWFQLLCDHPFLEYKSKDHELLPTIFNFINASNYLLNTNAQSLEELAHALSNEKQRIEITADTTYPSNIVLKIIFHTYNTQKVEIMEAYLEKDYHCYFVSPQTDGLTGTMLSKKIVIPFLKNNHQEPQKAHKLAVLRPLIKNNDGNELYPHRKIPTSHLIHHYLSSSLESMPQLLTALDNLCESSPENPDLIAVIMNIMKEFERTNHHTSIRISQLILKYNLIEHALLNQIPEAFIALLQKNKEVLLTDPILFEQFIKGLSIIEKYPALMKYMARLITDHMLYGSIDQIDSFVFKALVPTTNPSPGSLSVQEQRDLIKLLLPETSFNYFSNKNQYSNVKIHTALVQSNSLLHYAVQQRNKDAIQQLLSLNAQSKSYNTDQKSALDIALETGDSEIIALFQ